MIDAFEDRPLTTAALCKVVLDGRTRDRLAEEILHSSMYLNHLELAVCRLKNPYDGVTDLRKPTPCPRCSSLANQRC